MIDDAAEALARHILVAFPASTARTRADVERIQVPVGRLLGAMLDRRADRLAALPDTDWLDRRHAQLPAAAGAWRDALRQAAQFPAEAWEEHVAQAARLALSHLVRPAETAAADAFADGPERLPVATALARVRVFGAYGYLPEIAARYAERKGIAEIDRAGLERLLRRIDRRMVEDFGPDEWIALAGPLYDLVGSLEGAPDAVGTGMLRALFEAKGRDELAHTLVADGYTRDVLRARLADVILTPRVPQPSVPEASEPEPPASPPAPATPSGDDRRGATGTAPTHVEDVETDAVGTPTASHEPPADAPFEPELPHAPELGDLRETPPADDDAWTEAARTGIPADLAAARAAVGTEAGTATSGWGDPAPPASPLAEERRDEAASEPVGAPTAETRDLAPLLATESEADTASPAAAEPAPLPSAPPADGDAEPLWKRMLRPVTAAPPDAPPASAAPFHDDAPAAVLPPAPPPSADEPLWRRFAAPEATPPPEDDEDGWAVEPTLAAVPDVPAPLAPTAPLPPPGRTLADTFAVPKPAAFAETTGEATAGAASGTTPPGDAPADGGAPDATAPDATAATSLDALELTVLGSGAQERREGFVNALFDGSRDDYQTTLRQLADAPSWTAATEVIASEIFRKHRVNIYSEASIAFTDAVEARMDARGVR